MAVQARMFAVPMQCVFCTYSIVVLINISQSVAGIALTQADGIHQSRKVIDKGTQNESSDHRARSLQPCCTNIVDVVLCRLVKPSRTRLVRTFTTSERANGEKLRVTFKIAAGGDSGNNGRCIGTLGLTAGNLSANGFKLVQISAIFVLGRACLVPLKYKFVSRGGLQGPTGNQRTRERVIEERLLRSKTMINIYVQSFIWRMEKFDE